MRELVEVSRCPSVISIPMRFRHYQLLGGRFRVCCNVAAIPARRRLVERSYRSPQRTGPEVRVPIRHRDGGVPEQPRTPLARPHILGRARSRPRPITTSRHGHRSTPPRHAAALSPPRTKQSTTKVSKRRPPGEKLCPARTRFLKKRNAGIWRISFKHQSRCTSLMSISSGVSASRAAGSLSSSTPDRSRR
ncbi:MAG: hypothetical protein JWP01_3778 [Myxococcales bacterium]|nr:hypothetical protein [Myxococcales bacterium]